MELCHGSAGHGHPPLAINVVLRMVVAGVVVFARAGEAWSGGGDGGQL